MQTERTRYTLERALEAAQKGITKAGAARVLGCSRQTIVSYCKRWKRLAEAFEANRSEMVDLSEMALRGAVLRGEPWAVTFALKTLGKDEGYSERQEIVNRSDTLEVVTRVVRRNADHD
jgi:hypothetical protein